MRLIKTYSSENKTAKVYKNKDWDEHVVKFYRHSNVQGAPIKYLTKADSFHADADDAHSTAKSWVSQVKEDSMVELIIKGDVACFAECLQRKLYEAALIEVKDKKSKTDISSTPNLDKLKGKINKDNPEHRKLALQAALNDISYRFSPERQAEDKARLLAKRESNPEFVKWKAARKNNHSKKDGD